MPLHLRCRWSSAEHAALQEIAESVSRPYRAVREAMGLLMAAEVIANTKIAGALGISRSTVTEWREHFERDGIEWVGKLHERRGRRPLINEAVIDKMIAETTSTSPPAATQSAAMSALGALLGIWLGLVLTTSPTPWPLGLPFAVAGKGFSDGWRYMYVIGSLLALVGIALRAELPEPPRDHLRQLAAGSFLLGQPV